MGAVLAGLARTGTVPESSTTEAIALCLKETLHRLLCKCGPEQVPLLVSFLQHHGALVAATQHSEEVQSLLHEVMSQHTASPVQTHQQVQLITLLGQCLPVERTRHLLKAVTLGPLL